MTDTEAVRLAAWRKVAYKFCPSAVSEFSKAVAELTKAKS